MKPNFWAVRRLKPCFVALTLILGTLPSVASLANECRLLSAFREIQHLGYLSDQDILEKPEAGICGPTCAFNLGVLIQSARGERPKSNSKRRLVEWITRISQEEKKAHIWDGMSAQWLYVETREYFKSIGIEANFDVHSLRRYPFSLDVMNIRPSGHARILTIKWDQGEETLGHFMLLLGSKRGAQTALFLDPNSVEHIFEASYELGTVVSKLQTANGKKSIILKFSDQWRKIYNLKSSDQVFVETFIDITFNEQGHKVPVPVHPEIGSVTPAVRLQLPEAPGIDARLARGIEEYVNSFPPEDRAAAMEHAQYILSIGGWSH